MSNSSVEKGDTVKLSFIGKLDDGSVFDNSDDPMSVEVGTGKLIKGLDREIVGMEEGEQRNISVTPEDGYGEINPDLVQTVPIGTFQENDIEPKEGMMLKTPQGTCHVTEVSGQNVEVDFNHPLAGKNLEFDIKVEEIVKQ